ncbi:BTAD domain-containing putative transcriptional regulator [Streptomyces sp. NPDC047315]|uniref:AfsR/SARP family transcriptional regulator n=1 Tax=Streptomyces sp. NPDC047315 TaxID=3155142 RepID=UPI0033E34D7B
MRFYVLGSLRVANEQGELATLPGRKDRAFLAELLAHVGNVVSVDHLVESVWPADAPVKRINAVHVRVSRLRSLFRSLAGPGREGEVMLTESGAYRLAPSEVDANQFEMLLAAGVREREKGFLDKAADRLDRALALWEGEAFTDVTAGDCVSAEAERLTELRLTALEQQAEVRLAMGACSWVVSTLKPLVERHPLRETLHGHLMTALHRSNRSAEALAVYADLRSRLADELGADPTSDLRNLHRSILAHDPGDHRPAAPPAAAAQVAPPARREWSFPFQLPAATADFVPRRAVAAVLDAMTVPDPSTTTFAVVTGHGGVGKTAVAVHVAHRLRSLFPDGQFYVDLGGSTERPADPRVALARMLSTTACPASWLQQDVGAMATRFRDSLKDRRVLIVLDDAADEAQLHHLLPGNAESAVLITSRSRLTALPVTARVELAEMNQRQALTLFERVVGAARVGCEPTAAREVARLCHYLPLALRVAAARLAARPHWRFADLAARMALRPGLMTELTWDALSVRRCFAPAYGRLNDDDQRLYRVIGMSGVSVFSAHSASAVTALPPSDIVDALERLVDGGLLSVVHGDSALFRMYGLAAAYAREAAECDASVTEREAAEELWSLQDRIVKVHGGAGAVTGANASARRDASSAVRMC